MDCRTYRGAHPEENEEAREHLRSCADCRTFRRVWELLQEYPPLEPGPGFLRGVRARRTAAPLLRFAIPLVAAAAVLLAAAVLFLVPSPDPGGVGSLPPEEQMELAENLELLQNLELLRALEFVGDYPPPLAENPG